MLFANFRLYVCWLVLLHSATCVDRGGNMRLHRMRGRRERGRRESVMEGVREGGSEGVKEGDKE